MAFSGIEQPELRITFDTNLRFRTDELDLRLGSLSRLLSETGAFPTSFSKIGHCYKNSILRETATNDKEGSDCA